jgi:hypothetical protein
LLVRFQPAWAIDRVRQGPAVHGFAGTRGTSSTSAGGQELTIVCQLPNQHSGIERIFTAAQTGISE